ncbi:MAG: hypothetical protein JKY56_01560 [Kofleriaceae bacterium]|nr:hypothetical protein [Kofleriaceae bacterium]
MRNIKLTLAAAVAIAAVGLAPRVSEAQEVQPELTLGMETLGSIGANYSTGENSGAGATGIVDFSDTALLVRSRIQLYPNIRGGSAIGLQFPDADSELGAVFFHQAYAFLEGQHFDLKIGRSRLQSSVIEFPSVRDDDLLSYTDALNPMASGSTTEDHQFGNVLEATGIIRTKYFLSVHAEHLFLTPGDQNSEDFTLNSVGTTIAYRNIPARIDTGRVREIGAAFNYYNAKGDGRAAVWNTILGGAVNLNPDPIHLIDIRLQGIYTNGDGDGTLTDPNSTFRAQSMHGAAALRYLYSKSTIPTFQLALVGGHARYFDSKETSWSSIANGFYSLGADFSVGAQYQVESYSQGLRVALGTAEYDHRVQAVLRFGFEFTVNPLPKRNSILNTEHSYIP